MFTIARRFAVGVIAVVAILAGNSSTKTAHAQQPPSTQPLLNRDIRVPSGDAVTINASGVTLDLNGRNVQTATTGNGRGIVVNNVSGVTVKNGKIGAFNINVFATGSTNLHLESLQIVGANLPLSGGPSEIGILFISTRGSRVTHNTITGVGLGIFVRGPISGGNVIANNTLVGGPDTSRSPLGMCWNPLPGAAGTDPGPKGDLVYNNHVAQFLTGISFSAGTTGTIAKENTIVFVNAAFSGTTPGSSNITADNTIIQVAP
jgi:parallel beta-helix repeat protein